MSENAPPNVAILLARNASHISSWTARPLLPEAKSAGILPPTVLIITCCDTRCQPFEFLHLSPSDALVMRNVGGHVQALLPDIAALDAVVGLQEIMIVHHTDCGTTYYSDETIRDIIRKRLLPSDAPGPESLPHTNFGAIRHLEESLRQNVACLRESVLVRDVLGQGTKGYVFDVQTGEVRCVVE